MRERGSEGAYADKGKCKGPEACGSTTQEALRLGHARGGMLRKEKPLAPKQDSQGQYLGPVCLLSGLFAMKGLTLLLGREA